MSHHSLQQACLQHVVFQRQKELTMPKVRLKLKTFNLIECIACSLLSGLADPVVHLFQRKCYKVHAICKCILQLCRAAATASATTDRLIKILINSKALRIDTSDQMICKCVKMATL